MMHELEQAVRERAGERCEYCLLPQSVSRIRFPIDHVIARQHRGATEFTNLALACERCNRHKGPNVAGVDPISRTIVPLFNPRTEQWSEHFELREALIVGRTASARETVVVFNINHPSSVDAREQLIVEGLFPPPISG